MIVAETTGITIKFDPLDTEKNVGSVKFNISIEFSTQNQKSSYQISNVWIEEKELKRFEAQLDSKPIAQLTDMSDYTLLSFEHVDDYTKIEINPIKERMSDEYDRLNTKLFVDYNLITYLYRAFKDYPKWW
ncbi:hypothetical protein [Pleionea sediminis]|uniref:hypothetical protein n=1 Tax=Pleionea sediminis TaxID=2569479 RepID=UPI001186E461|nr:hypothetical protein [Pleionea sediminis]